MLEADAAREMISDADARKWELPSYEPWLPVSEKSNPLTCDIDRASANRIVQLLEACDAQMFQENTGPATYERLFSDSVVETMMKVAKQVELILKDPEDGLIVLSGAGTSGRLAFLLTTSFNRALRDLHKEPGYAYLIAGGDRSLLTSQEAPEDDPTLGMLSLEKISEGKRRVLFIGISCGLSAPYVAGQLDLCLQNPEVFTPVILGFNPVSQARDEPIPGSHLTFRSLAQVMQELQGSQRAFIINPAVGPEAISGSSRMKGGSATKILLETVLSAAHTAAYTHTPISHGGMVERMRAYERAHDITYSQSEKMAALVQAAGQSLQRGGRVCYLGWGSLGVLGLIDASECTPTFGADYEDIRGFISGGYTAMENTEGQLTSLGPQFCITHKDFVRVALPTLTDRDTVILLFTHHDDVRGVEELAHRVRERTSNLHALHHGRKGDTAPVSISHLCSSVLDITWPAPSAETSLRMQWELSTKLVLNAVSTGGHVMKGKIYRNHMIDLQVTNSKLYHRATRLLQRLSGRTQPQCERALLQAVYELEELEELPPHVTSSGVSTHTRTASHRSRVVPLALICLLIGCSLSEARSRLTSCPVVRDAVEACLASVTSSPGDKLNL